MKKSHKYIVAYIGLDTENKQIIGSVEISLKKKVKYRDLETIRAFIRTIDVKNHFKAVGITNIVHLGKG